MAKGTTTTNGLKVDALSCVRGDSRLFHMLSFAVAPGQGLWLRGANGSGKSSLLRIVAGLLTPASGTIALDGQSIDANRGALAYLGHLDGLKPFETPQEALAFAARLRGGKADPNGLAHVGMQPNADTPIRYLSAGQRRRVALASVLTSGAKLWLLDEPTTALDAASSALIYGALRQHLDRGGMFMVATHDDPPAMPGTDTLVLGV